MTSSLSARRARETGGPRSARAVLDAALVRELTSGRRVFVAFSGGRDSSALLALLTHLARDLGAPEPVPLIMRWDHPSMEEDVRFQQHVLDALSLVPEVIDVPRSESGVLGSRSRAGLEQHGLVWPLTVHAHRLPMLERARGHVLVDGEGGDDIFGATRTRLLHHLRLLARHPTTMARMLYDDLAPLPLRRRRAWRTGVTHGCYTADGVEEVWKASLEQDVQRPLSSAAAILHHAALRRVRLGHQTLDALAAAHDVVGTSPLLAEDFLLALAGEAGRRGWSGRAVAMRRVFGDVVDDVVLSRSSKADFSEVLWTRETRQWLASWDGTSGVEGQWVDGSLLSAEWTRPAPHAGTALMAQAAWVAQELGRAPVV